MSRRNPLRIAHIVDWTNGESYIALIDGDTIVGRFDTYRAARDAYAVRKGLL